MFLCLIPIPGLAEEEPTRALEAYITAWAALSVEEELPLEERLEEQTRLIYEGAERVGWTAEPVWDWIQATLDLWETSPNIELARETYLNLLEAIGESLQGENQPFAEEERLRGYFQRALSLELTPVEEGTLLLFLGESWLRTANGDRQVIRRAESLFQRAEEVLGETVPMDAVHVHLGELRLTGSNAFGEKEAPHLTEAVIHFRAAQRLADSRERYVQKASEELKKLVQPELELKQEKRYLPQNTIRVEIRSRNIPYIEVDLVPLTSLGGIPVTRMETLKRIWEDYEPSPDQVILSRRYPVRTRTPYDWAETSIRLGGDYDGGWYGLRISAGGIERKELLMVTALEVVAIPRASGELGVWVTDVEKGKSLAGAIIQVLDGEGSVISSRESGENGFVLLEPDAVEDWEELQVVSEENPGILIRGKQQPETGIIPWVIPGSLEIRPGQALPFVVLGSPEDPWLKESAVPDVLLPDNTVGETHIHLRGSGWLSGEVMIPESIEKTGPLYMKLPYGHQIRLAHLSDTRMLPLQVRFVGERLRSDANLFVSTSALELQLDGPAQVWDTLPEYIRLRITRMDRARHLSEDGQPAQLTGEKVLMETIFSRAEAQNNGTLVTLPDNVLPDNIGEASVLPLRVEVLTLDEDDILGRAYSVLMDYRRVVHLDTSERIILSGESVDVEVAYENLSTGSWFMNDGDLAIYREIWESRYIHRKKGNLITESEYMILPDRSLLGAAKTDFRLVEQGYVREEVQRIPIKASNPSQTVPISFDLPGYYRIEFENGESGVISEYQDGSLEVWVLPGDGDLHAFRAKQPRAIVERNKTGSYEILLLLDRITDVLMHFEDEDGNSMTRIIRPEHPAVTYDYSPENGARLSTCRFVIVGDRSTHYLWKRFRRQTEADWKIETTRRIGVNSGDSFEWPLHPYGEPATTPIFWTFFPDKEAPLVNRSLHWQSQLHADKLDRQPVSIMLLEDTFPLFHPLDDTETGSVLADQKTDFEILTATDLMSLYPDVRLKPTDEQRVTPFSMIRLSQPGIEPQLTGNFPNTTGRWRLELFGQSDSGDLSIEDWLVSTDQPIRSQLEGPAVLRMGDHAEMRMQLENTTRNTVDIGLELETEGMIRFTGSLSESVKLAAESKKELLFPVQGIAAGEGKIIMQVSGSGSQQNTLHSMAVQEELPARVWSFQVISPQNGIWTDSRSFLDWGSGQFLTSPGLGSLLPELWPLVRDAQAGQEPVLVALGDWALARMIDLHGLPEGLKPTHATENLIAILSAQKGADSGWAWTEGAPSDPWLTALVLWTLDTFKDDSSGEFDALNESARLYLEDILIDNKQNAGIRLFTLRALSANAFHSEKARPSRIQARSFLDFLYQRADLSAGDLAILLEIARAFRFREEVTLLNGDIRQILSAPSHGEALGFFEESLLFLAFNEADIKTDSPVVRLEKTFQALEEVGPRRSWEQVAGILNLMSAFYWKGEFNVDGQVSMTINDREAVDISLNPDMDTSSLYRIRMDNSMLDKTDLTVDTTFALSPIVLAYIGSLAGSPDVPGLPDHQIQLFREYDEPTLLAGSRMRQIELEAGVSMARPGETLRLRLSFTISEGRPYAELCFPVPAGLSIEDQIVAYSYESLSAEPNETMTPTFTQVDIPHDSCRRIRLEPLSAGRHVVEIPFRVKWSGTYAWPDNVLLFPKSGQFFRIPNAGPLTILNREE